MLQNGINYFSGPEGIMIKYDKLDYIDVILISKIIISWKRSKRMSENGYCDIAFSYFNKIMINVSVRQIKYSINKLKEYNIIYVQSKHGKVNKYKPNVDILREYYTFTNKEIDLLKKWGN